MNSNPMGFKMKHARKINMPVRLMAALSGDAEEGEVGEGDESSDGDAGESSEEQGSEEQ